MAEGYGLEPGQMIEEGSKGRGTIFVASEICRVGFLVAARVWALGKFEPWLRLLSWLGLVDFKLSFQSSCNWQCRGLAFYLQTSS